MLGLVQSQSLTKPQMERLLNYSSNENDLTDYKLFIFNLNGIIVHCTPLFSTGPLQGVANLFSFSQNE